MLNGGGLDADALFAPLAAEPALLLAVSGGPDSMALMLLAARWSQRKVREIAVATVDHGLRPEARAEAELVGDAAAKLGFRHFLLRWEGDKPKTRLQERARAARYALLAACASDIAPDCALVTAHHADDQAETILFRLTRGSGVAGLAGMAPASARDGVKLLRPLLGVGKAALEDYCRDAGLDFVRDPSNADKKFARARLRGLGATLSDQGLTTPALLRLGARAAQAEDALAYAAACCRETALIAENAHETRFCAAALRHAPRELLQRLVAAEIDRLCGADRLRLDRLERAAEALAAGLAGETPVKITLGGALAHATPDELVLRPAPPRRPKG